MTIWKLLLVPFLSIFLCTSFSVKANTTRDIFAKYPNEYFIETGSFMGEGIRMALEAGFEKIYSIEISPHYYEHCKQRFASYPGVTIIQGDSAYILGELLKRIDGPATFWLDGHYSCVAMAGKGETNTPLLAELESIRQHPVKTHTILIDDIRLLATEHLDYLTLDQITKKILEINPNYQITFEDGVISNDVLVAFIP